MTENRNNKSMIYVPSFFLGIMFLLKISESIFGINLSHWGILPRTISGLWGILTAPLIHGSWSHLFSNSAAFFFLSMGLFFFYKKVSYNVFIFIYLISGLLVWIFARDSYHIGASGLVYGLASFLFFGGIFRKNIKLMAISLLIVFLYGGLIWGILPGKKGISWESHLAGGIVGLVLAKFFSKKETNDNTQIADNTEYIYEYKEHSE